MTPAIENGLKAEVAVLLSAHQLTKSFSSRPLFEGLTFSIDEGEKIGLIGPNGAGKSTLLKILSSQTSQDQGSLSFKRGIKVGFVEQDPKFNLKDTIESALHSGSLIEHENWELRGQVEEYFSRLELDQFGMDFPVEKLSGGWKKRVAIGRELVKKPDLLLLDEPTNHLDIESILWLEEQIKSGSFAAVVITHDRAFLQKISNRILEIDPRHKGGLLSVQGDYGTYLEVRSELIRSQENREVILRNTLRRETEWLRRGAKARTTKQQARIARAEGLKNEVEELKGRNLDRTARIDFQSSDRSPKKLIEAKGVSKEFGSKKIFTNLDLIITPGTRLGLLGTNGSGKSTLIKVLLGGENPTQGTVTRSDLLKVAYFDQTREALDPDVTVSKAICPAGEYVDYRNLKVHIRSYLDRFLFTQGQMDMTVGKLSGGEQSRLLIAKLMLETANLLVLDEPTNDLDIATLNILQDCLVDFNGAVILVTHDRFFLDQVANQIIAFPLSDQNRKLVSFSSLDQWELWHQSELRAKKVSGPQFKKVVEGSVSKAVEGAGSPAQTKRKKLGFNEQRELSSIEAKIEVAELRVKLLTDQINAPENQTHATKLSGLTHDLAEAQAEVERLYLRWQQLEN